MAVEVEAQFPGGPIGRTVAFGIALIVLWRKVHIVLGPTESPLIMESPENRPLQFADFLN
jgi:hypothetical protein